MKIQILTIVTLALSLTIGCTRANKEIKVPSFRIAVELSPEAQKNIKERGETIIVAAYFDGDGSSLPGEHNEPFRDVYLG